MAIQLRQICLVAQRLQPVVQDLTSILGINPCYVDPGVATFGLENTLMPVGRNFLEVVAPVREGTAAGRYLERRRGDGGYMVITQADSRETQLQLRQNAEAAGVRVAFEMEKDDYHLCQLHPGDLRAAFLEIDSDAHNDLTGYWHPAGGSGWEDKVKQDVTVDFRAVWLQGPDPLELAELWGRVTGLPVAAEGPGFEIQLNNAKLLFMRATDGRGPGLGAIDIEVADRPWLQSRAKERGALVHDRQIHAGGVRWNLLDA